MRWAIQSLHQSIGQWSHGQALLVVGDTGIGKTTLQNDIIDPLTDQLSCRRGSLVKGTINFQRVAGRSGTLADVGH